MVPSKNWSCRNYIFVLENFQLVLDFIWIFFRRGVILIYLNGFTFIRLTTPAGTTSRSFRVITLCKDEVFVTFTSSLFIFNAPTSNVDLFYVFFIPGITFEWLRGFWFMDEFPVNQSIFSIFNKSWKYFNWTTYFLDLCLK